MAAHIDLGRSGEELAAAWYRAHGYDVVDRNWRCELGELDLVVARAGVLAIVEVKTRRTDAFGVPALAVDAAKQRRLRLLAARWLATHRTRRRFDVRFDVASVVAGEVTV